MKHGLPALRIFIFLTLITGVAYPLAVTAISQLLFPHAAEGSLAHKGDAIVGSRLVAQEFKSPRYFWSRPSAAGYNPLPSSGSNLGPTSADLKKAFSERRVNLVAAHPDAGEPPQDLLFASGSGLDPEISPAAAHFQISRVARARMMAVQEVENLVNQLTHGRQWGLLGEPRLNVLELNLALDEAEARRTK